MSFFFRVSFAIGCLGVAVLLANGGLISPGLVRAENSVATGAPSDANAMRALLGAWELVKKAENGGPEKPVAEGANTLMEFSQDGAVIVTKTSKDNPSKPDIRPGKFSVEGSTMVITDDAGNTARCQYRLDGDTLVVSIPDIGKEFQWRRVK